MKAKVERPKTSPAALSFDTPSFASSWPFLSILFLPLPLFLVAYLFLVLVLCWGLVSFCLDGLIAFTDSSLNSGNIS